MARIAGHAMARISAAASAAERTCFDRHWF
jgi:hypothetical protein